MDEIAKQDGAIYLARMRQWQSWGLNRPLELFFECVKIPDCRPSVYVSHQPTSHLSFSSYSCFFFLSDVSDGEYLGWYNNIAHALEEDKVLVADYEKLQIPRLPDGQRDWMTYTTRWRTKNTETFKAAILQAHPSDITYNATYGEYTVGGDSFFRPYLNDSWMWTSAGKWAEMRPINSPGRTSQNGDNHYGTNRFGVANLPNFFSFLEIFKFDVSWQG
eukprot:SAG31_NODE_4434_length_3233_cov_1.725909_2_plen_218_part_00